MVLAMASLGLAIALRGLVQIIWSGDVQRYPRETRKFYQLAMDVRVPPDAIFITIVTVILVVAVYLVLTRTKIGKAMRATADNPNLALVSGIDTQRVIWSTWIIGAVLAATAGILLAVFQAQLLPIMGWKFLIPLFAAVILGGIGNPYGALVGAFIIGVSSEVSTQWINPSYKPRGGLRHYDGGAAGEAQGHIRRRQVSIAIDWKRPGSSPEGREVMDIAGIADYFVGFLVMAGIYAVFSLGLNVHWGYTGLFNIGIAGFFALGAYTAALMTTQPPDPTLFEDFKFGGQLVRNRVSWTWESTCGSSWVWGPRRRCAGLSPW